MADEIERDFRDGTTRDKIMSMKEGGMKSILIRDANGRIQTAYEAHITAQIGDTCLRTELKYIDGAGGTSRQVVAYEELVTAWPGYEILNAGYANDINNVP